MASVRHVDVGSGDVLILIGTMKGAFLFRSRPQREEWQMGGPYFQGVTVYAMAYDGRGGRKRLLVGGRNEHFAPDLFHSDDFGRSWTGSAVPRVQYPAAANLAVEKMWQITPGNATAKDTVYVGVEPAGLFVSHDAGGTFKLVQGLHDHPHRAKWTPGGGGLCMHTVLPHPVDPKKILVALSTGGVYRTEDGGDTWHVSNTGVRADFNPDKYPEFGQCVHKVARDATDPERLFLQNHGGLYRSDDGGRTWNDIGRGVPSDFGFPIVTHPRKANTAYCIPLDDQMRTGPGGKPGVYRTTADGAGWEPIGKGYVEDAYETVLRDGMSEDSLDPAGLYFGTRSGKLYGSNDEGENWRILRDGLPAITCVKTCVIP